jgi:hypothetical protein
VRQQHRRSRVVFPQPGQGQPEGGGGVLRVPSRSLAVGEQVRPPADEHRQVPRLAWSRPSRCRHRLEIWSGNDLIKTIARTTEGGTRKKRPASLPSPNRRRQGSTETLSSTINRDTTTSLAPPEAYPHPYSPGISRTFSIAFAAGSYNGGG